MRVSDIIAAFINDALANSSGEAELSRAELAAQFGCVPSQINYVLMTRFTPEHGYLVETKRGGGGYIRVTKVEIAPETLVMHTVNAVGDELDARSAAAFLQNLSEVVEPHALGVIAAAVSDSALHSIPPDVRDAVRAAIIKQCLLHL